MATTKLKRSQLPVRSVTLCVPSPTTSDDITMFFTDEAVTITKQVTVVKGSSTPSVTVKCAHGTDRSAAGTNLITSPSATTNTTGGTSVTSFDNSAVASGSFFRAKFTAVSGTVDYVEITIFYQ